MALHHLFIKMWDEKNICVTSFRFFYTVDYSFEILTST